MDLDFRVASWSGVDKDVAGSLGSCALGRGVSDVHAVAEGGVVIGHVRVDFLCARDG